MRFNFCAPTIYQVYFNASECFKLRNCFKQNKMWPGDEDERDYDGKRPGAPLNGLSSKKRRKQSKPIRLGSDSIASEEGGEEGPSPEDGEAHYRRVSGDSGGGAGQPPYAGGRPPQPVEHTEGGRGQARVRRRAQGARQRADAEPGKVRRGCGR